MERPLGKCLQPGGDLEPDQFTEEWADADAGIEVARPPDDRLLAFVVPEVWRVQGKLHEPGEGKGAPGRRDLGPDQGLQLKDAFLHVRPTLHASLVSLNPSAPDPLDSQSRLWCGVPVQRLDQVLVDRGLCESRAKAQRLIMAGQVRVNGHPARKASDPVRDGDPVEVLLADRYVSRGGHKLEHALVQFAIPVKGVTALDLGASTGGFTDCLLQHGAARVVAVDVGHGQLAWKLRQDPRVVVMERTNARHLDAESFAAGLVPFDLIVADCSFISLRHILPPAAALLRGGGHLLPLVKPQFEAGKAEVDRGEGVITDPAIHARVLEELEAFVRTGEVGLAWRGVIPSPLLGPAGNREFLGLLERLP
ncbi:MAG: TlyA family RNA methyltransferase [Verrucomicrobia bacterium]|nr:TlyA family RNA methyltransferase [Verrucomicrobiota bacterium]